MEVAQSIQFPTELGEKLLEIVLEAGLRVVLRDTHGFLQELHRQGQKRGNALMFYDSNIKCLADTLCGHSYTRATE